MIDAKVYMERKCICGHERAVHMHGYTRAASGEPLVLSTIPCGCCGCRGFIDEFELELGGNPSQNKYLAELMPEVTTHPFADQDAN